QDAVLVGLSDFLGLCLVFALVNLVRIHVLQLLQLFDGVAMSYHGKPSIMLNIEHIMRFDKGMKSRLQRRWKRLTPLFFTLTQN
ncbi:hypothetical protein LW972_18000, partial [Erwinia amylovora]|nr:hypothetical protein [Erwinia amylovora]